MTHRSTRWGLALVLAVTLGVGTAAQKDAPVDKQLQAAIHKEMVDGDLRGAIETYRKVVAQAGSNRALAAQALLRMAECHTKLGDDQARQAYERLVREYGDMPEAKTARARIGATGKATATSTVATDRIVKAGETVTKGDGRVSSDGRYISYTDWDDTGNLMLHDLVSGSDRPLTGNTDWNTGNAYASTFSPDGRHVAYGWVTYAKAPAAQVTELRIVPVDAPPGTQSRRVYASAEIRYFESMDWSPDGQSIAVVVTRPDRSAQIALVGVNDGTFRSLKTVAWRGPLQVFFSPDGRYLAYDLPSSDTSPNRDVLVMAVDGSRETVIVDHAAQDVVMGWSRDGKRLLFASDRTGVVGLWSVAVEDGRPHGAPTLMKPDIGSIRSQGLTATGALHILKDTSTESLQIAPIDIASGRLSGPAVLESARSQRPSWSRDRSRLAYVVIGLNGVRHIAVREIASGRLRQYPMPFEYLLDPVWLPDGQSLVVFGRDFKGEDGIHRIDVATGTTTTIADADRSVVNVSPDGRRIYYQVGSETLGAGQPMRLVEHDLATGNTREVRRGDGTGGELSPDGRTLATLEPRDDGKRSTLVLVPISEGESARRIDLAETFGRRASWLPDGKAVLAFAHKGGLWVVPVDGSAPRKLDIDTREWSVQEHLRLDPSGTHIAFFTGKDAREVWALESVAQR